MEIQNEMELSVPRTKSGAPFDNNILNVMEIESWHAMTVTNDNEERLAGLRLNHISLKKKQIKAHTDIVIKPFKDQVKVLEDIVRGPMNMILMADQKIRAAMGGYATAKKRAADEAERKRRQEIADQARKDAQAKAAEAAATNSEAKFEQAVEAEKVADRIATAPVNIKSASVRSEVGQTAYRTDWHWRVVDEAKVPRNFLVVDEKKLNQAAKGFSKFPMSVDGVEFYEVQTPISRTA